MAYNVERFIQTSWSLKLKQDEDAGSDFEGDAMMKWGSHMAVGLNAISMLVYQVERCECFDSSSC